MKVAISAQGETLQSSVEPRFGRAPYFILVDTETGSHQAVDNELNVAAVQGAGVQTAQFIAGQKANVVLTGHCGPKAFRTLEAAGIKVYVGMSGTVQQALAELEAEKLTPTADADVEGHWT